MVVGLMLLQEGLEGPAAVVADLDLALAVLEFLGKEIQVEQALL